MQECRRHVPTVIATAAIVIKRGAFGLGDPGVFEKMLGPDLIAGIAQPLRGQVLSKSLRWV